MTRLSEILEKLEHGASRDSAELIQLLPGKNCGLCGFRNCADLLDHALAEPNTVKRCVYLLEHEIGSVVPARDNTEFSWKDLLERDYDFVLDKFDDDPGPREHILLGNPLNLERLGIKKGDVLIGRPVMSVGCPVTHCGVVMKEPDYFNGAVVWCITGMMDARERGIEIGYYHILAYEGMVRQARVELQFGRRYDFLPRYCMLQARHSGLINTIKKTADGYSVRLEGIGLG